MDHDTGWKDVTLPVPTVSPKQLSIAANRSIITAMGDLLKLIWYDVAGLFRSRAALQTEVLALRHQLNVLRRRAPKSLIGALDCSGYCITALVG
jgi:hypothetical protein